MAEREEGQKRSRGPLRRTLLDLASHPRIPQGAYLVTISIVVGLATALSCVLFLSVLKWITWLSFEAWQPALHPFGPYLAGLAADVLVRFHVRDLGHLPVVQLYTQRIRESWWASSHASTLSGPTIGP